MNRDRLVAAAAPDILCLLGHRQVAIIFLISKHFGCEERFGFTSASYQCNAFVNGTYVVFDKVELTQIQRSVPIYSSTANRGW